MTDRCVGGDLMGRQDHGVVVEPFEYGVERVEDGDVRVEIDHRIGVALEQEGQRLPLHRGAGLDDVVLEEPRMKPVEAQLLGEEHAVEGSQRL